jgi:hypothetical protein
MLFEIKNRWNDEVIFKLETESFKLCVIAAVKSRANLYGADLSRANLTGADLYGANLYGANLSRANLTGADLYGADLSRANLYGADLSGANLYGANLTGADLSGANLTGANLTGADLSGANLTGADLSGANLYGADLSGAEDEEYIIAKTQICPQEGAFVGWKKLQGGVIAKLVILHDAKRMNSLGSRKCRASKVFVHEMFGAKEAYDQHTGRLLYKEGEEIIPDSYDDDVRVECSNGIHFFMTRIEAERY